MSFIFKYVVFIFILCFAACSPLSQANYLVCDDPCDNIIEPKNSNRNPSNHFFTKWKLNSMVSYNCLPGHKFPDGDHHKVSQCLLNQNNRDRAQWEPNKYYDCIPYCSPLCINGGQCQLNYKDVNNESSLFYECQCPENFVGKYCEKSVCHHAPYVANSDAIILDSGEQSPLDGKYTVGSVISYGCRPGFSIRGRNQLTCNTDRKFWPYPPTCEVSTQHVKDECFNEYYLAKVSLQHPLSESTLLKHAIIYPQRERYHTSNDVRFVCPTGTILEGSSSVKCLLTNYGSGWESQWPMCKVKTCPNTKIQNGYMVITPGVPSTVGSTMFIKCLDGYHIFEDKPTKFTCMGYAFWGPQLSDCIDKNIYKNRCLLNGKLLKYRKYPNGPYCAEVYSNANSQSQNQLNTITIVTASAAAVFGVLLLIVLLVALQRRRLIHRIRRAALEREREEGENGGGGIYEATIHFMLPSYDEAVRSKPTTSPPTFEEVLQETNQSETAEDVISDENNSMPDFPSIRSSRYSTTTMVEDFPDENPPPYSVSTLPNLIDIDDENETL